MKKCYILLIVFMLITQLFMMRNIIYFEIRSKSLQTDNSKELIKPTIQDPQIKENNLVNNEEIKNIKNEGNKTETQQPTPKSQENNDAKIDALLRILPEEITENLPSKFIKRLKYTYPPYVLPPPINEEPEFVESKFYRSSLNNKKKCNIEMCNKLTNHLNQYLPNSCETLKCKDDTLYRVIFEEKNLIGYVDIIKDSAIKKGFSCGIYSNTKSIPENDHNVEPHIQGKLVYLVTPEGYSFQHFLDSVMPKIVQIEDFIKDENVKFYIGLKRSKFPIVEKLYNRIGINSSRLIGTDHVGVYAEELIIPCYCPTMHPYLWQRTQYLFKLPYLFENKNDIQNNNNVNLVVYISRNTNSFNKGRRILNEKELLDLIRKSLENTNYHLVVYDSKKYENNVDEMVKFWDKVKVLIGSHGGGLYNMFFMRKGSTIIEFLPRSNAFYKKLIHLIIYSHSVMLGNYYYNLMCQSFNHFNMQVDLEKFELLFANVIDNLK